MREINNNFNNLNFKGIQKASETQPTQPEAPVANQNDGDLKKLSNLPAATLGQTQVTTDSVEGDMKFLLSNPEEAQVLLGAFDNYVAKGHTYEEATQLMEAHKKEFMATKK